MKQGRTLTELAAELQRQAETKKDYLASTMAMTAVVGKDDAILMEGINGGTPLLDTAHAQLGTILAIPKPYYDRMKANAPDLLAKNVNHWLHSQDTRKMVSCLDGGIRAILSDKFRPLDNLDLAETVLPKLIEAQAEVVSCEVTPHRMYLKAITDTLAGEVKKGDMIKGGIVVSNSEIGEGTLSVSQYVVRLVCLNGAVMEQAVKKTHTGKRVDGFLEEGREYFRTETRELEDRTFFAKVQDSVGGILSQSSFERALTAMRESVNQPLPTTISVPEVVEVVAKRFGFGEQGKASILDHLVRGGDISSWGLANAITRASQDLPSYDDATDWERIGGQIIALPASTWK